MYGVFVKNRQGSSEIVIGSHTYVEITWRFVSVAFRGKPRVRLARWQTA